MRLPDGALRIEEGPLHVPLCVRCSFVTPAQLVKHCPHKTKRAASQHESERGADIVAGRGQRGSRRRAARCTCSCRLMA